jgi:hypothetical protein
MSLKSAPFQITFSATNNRQGQQYNFPVVDQLVNHFIDLGYSNLLENASFGFKFKFR